MFNTIEDMSLFELSRWCTLFAAVNLVADECEERNLNFNTINLEPLYIRKYVEKISDNVARVIQDDNDKDMQKKVLKFKNSMINNLVEVNI